MGFGRERDERPAPVALPGAGGLWIPAELTAELAGALALLDTFVRGTPPPAACKASRLSRPALAVMIAARDAATQYQAREHARRACPPPTPVTPVVLGAGQPVSALPLKEITTTAAAGQFGRTAERWRQLAAAGRVRARRGERGTWMLLKADVVNYARGRQENTDGIHGDQDTARPRRQAG